jgi:hypothetical protein
VGKRRILDFGLFGGDGLFEAGDFIAQVADLFAVCCLGGNRQRGQDLVFPNS